MYVYQGNLHCKFHETKAGEEWEGMYESICHKILLWVSHAGVMEVKGFVGIFFVLNLHYCAVNGL